MWIYGTITDSLTETILKPKSSARELWLALKGLFRDNKENRALELENDLRTITIGDLTVQEYCRKLKSLSDLLANVDSPITDRQLVMHCLNGLNEKFDGIHNVIRHRSPFPSFNTTRSMLQSEEDRLKKQTRPLSSSPAANTSSPTVVYSDENYGNNTRGNKSRGRGGGRGNRGRGQNNNNNNSGPMTYGNSGPTNFGYPQWPFGPKQWSFPYYSGPMPPSPSSFPALFMAPPSHRPSSILGPYAPRPQAHLTQEAAPDGSSNMVPTALAHAFNTMSLQPPYDPAWYMDTTATNHITAEQGSAEQENSSPV